MRIAVIGAGAIGSVAGAYLSDQHDVFLVAKKHYVDALNKCGLFIKGVRGEKLFRLRATTSLKEKVDLVIICTKTQDLKSALSANSEFIKDAVVLTSQNGVQADNIAAEFVDKNNLLSSIVMFGATYLKDGEAIHNFEGDWIIGSYFGNNQARINLAAGALKDGFKVVTTENISGMKWTKVFVNFNNCLPAILGKSMQEAFSNIEIAKISIRLLAEGLATVDKAGIKLAALPDFDISKFRGLTGMPLEQAAGIFSGIMRSLSKEPLYGSILQSIKRNRPSEIDYINGEIVNLGKEKGVATPLNEKVARLVKTVERTSKFLSEEQLVNEFTTVGLADV